MYILPAIDLKDGNCVRLRRGDFDTVHTVAESPVAVARIFEAAGAEHIHMVDLDGALDGVRVNAEIIREVCASVTAKVEMGGGVRSVKDIEEVFSLGVWRVVIGSAAVSNPDFVREAVEKYGERVAVGVDARDGRVRTHGWTQDSRLDAIEFARSMEALGVKTLIFTDIDTDGMLSGPPVDTLRKLRRTVSCAIIASGGIAIIDDILNIKAIGIDAAIIGKAYYAGTLDLAEAIRKAGE